MGVYRKAEKVRWLDICVQFALIESTGAEVANLYLTCCRFDTIKTRMQCSPPGAYRGAMDVFTTIIRNEVRLVNRSVQHRP